MKITLNDVLGILGCLILFLLLVHIERTYGPWPWS